MVESVLLLRLFFVSLRIVTCSSFQDDSRRTITEIVGTSEAQRYAQRVPAIGMHLCNSFGDVAFADAKYCNAIEEVTLVQALASLLLAFSPARSLQLLGFERDGRHLGANKFLVFDVAEHHAALSRSVNSACTMCACKIPAGVEEFVEPAATAAANSVKCTLLELPGHLATGSVQASFIPTSADIDEAIPPIVLLHSFDSSCLEFRRLMPLLDAAGVEAYALDSLGWGFASTENVKSIGVEAKREHLRAFLQQHLGGRAAMLVGSSLGCATIIDFVASYPKAVHSVLMMDPQGFIDGTPPVPEFLARPGIKLLRSWPLRSLGQVFAYEDQKRCNTDDAVRVGRLHCSRKGWEDDQVQWLLGGGYSVSHLVAQLAVVPSVILWGRQDRVLPPAENVPKFRAALPSADFRWVENCGHVPHLEQPEVVAEAIKDFLQGSRIKGDDDTSSLLATS